MIHPSSGQRVATVPQFAHAALLIIDVQKAIDADYGVSTNNSVEATVRMAGNLGFKTFLVADACFTFARRDFHGSLRTADEVHSMSLANLDGEYCTVLDTVAILADR